MNEEEPIPYQDTVKDHGNNRKKHLIIGLVAILLLGGVLSTTIYGAFKIFKPFSDQTPEVQPAVYSPTTIGMKGLEQWNISGQRPNYDELLSKYQALYEYTYPYLLKEALKQEIIPTGVPGMYGEELGVSFEANTDAMTAILRKYEDEALDDALMERYKEIGLNISCEYCCNAKAIIFENGERACGCAHSFAMRGLAKYLLINHPDHYTNQEILMELGKWKATFFPKQTMSKAVAKYAEIGNIDPAVLVEMPNMVGSC